MPTLATRLEVIISKPLDVYELIHMDRVATIPVGNDDAVLYKMHMKLYKSQTRFLTYKLRPLLLFVRIIIQIQRE